MRRRGIALLALALVAGAYLAATLARDLQPFDSAEFALDAAQLGVGHPPGQPAYVLVAALFAHLCKAPLGLSILSALSTVIWLVLAARIASDKYPSVAAAVAATALLVLGAWDLATRPEVYAPATALLVAALAVAAGGTRAARALVAGLLLGAAAGVNPVMAAPVGAIVLLHICARRQLAPVGLLAVGALAGLGTYLLLPWAGAHRPDALVWGAPLRGPSLWHYLAGRDYRSWGLGGGEYVANLGRAAAWLVETRLVLFALGGAAGALAARGRPWALRLAPSVTTLAGLVAIAANHPFVPDNPDYVGYLLPSLAFDVAGVGLLCERVLDGGTRPRAVVGAALAALVVFGASGTPSLWARDRRRSDVVRTVAERTLAAVPHDGVLLVASDHLVFPCLYLQEVEGQRPDVVIVDAGWASSSWIWRHVGARHPALRDLTEAAATGKLPFGHLAEVLPPREARIAAFLAAAHRPVAAETLQLAALAGARPGGGGWVSLAPSPPTPLSQAGEGSHDAVAGDLAELAKHVRAGSLDERVLAQTAIARAEESWALGDAATTFARLRAALRPSLLAGLDDTPPRDSDASLSWRARTPLEVPRALVGADVLLLRLGDLVRPSRPALAAQYYARSGAPEAEQILSDMINR